MTFLSEIPKTIEKKDLTTIAESVVAKVEDGYMDASEAYVFADAIWKISDSLKKKFKPEKKDYALGVELTPSDSATYDYDGCCEYLDKLEAEVKAIKELAKTAANMTRPAPLTYVTPDGEHVMVHPAKKKWYTIVKTKYQ